MGLAEGSEGLGVGQLPSGGLIARGRESGTARRRFEGLGHSLGTALMTPPPPFPPNSYNIQPPPPPPRRPVPHPPDYLTIWSSSGPADTGRRVVGRRGGGGEGRGREVTTPVLIVCPRGGAGVRGCGWVGGGRGSGAAVRAGAGGGGCAAGPPGGGRRGDGAGRAEPGPQEGGLS